jgi:hypothetical protein
VSELVHSGSLDHAGAIAYLRSPLAIRARCENVLAAGLAGGLAHFAIELGRLDAVADRVVAVTRAAYPTLAIPVHGRTGHFRAGGVDRVAALDAELAAAGADADERARAWVDLIVVSVLLDAGAGDAWRFREPGTELSIGRSEGLAVASLHAFRAGRFSADPARPLRVDADALRRFDAGALAAAFGVTDANPLVGLDGRAGLIRALGDALAAAPVVFRGGRPGGLVDAYRERGLAVGATDLLRVLLEGLGPIWPGRIELRGTNLGDVWPHPAAGGRGLSAGLVPFHKLSQWLAYSLFEPLERAGLAIKNAGALTGLPEYRNGGLLVDLGVLEPRHPAVTTEVHAAGDEIIVEWRALTVAILDRVADRVRALLGKTADELPLARVLEGGTWAAGRQVAAELRPGGGPPIRVASDGTVF